MCSYDIQICYYLKQPHLEQKHLLLLEPEHVLLIAQDHTWAASGDQIHQIWEDPTPGGVGLCPLAPDPYMAYAYELVQIHINTYQCR